MNDQLAIYMLGAITVATEILGGAIMLVIYISVLLSGDNKNRRSRLFAYSTLTLGVAMFLEAATWLLETHPGPLFHNLLTTVNFFSHSLVTLNVFLFICYILEVISEKVAINKNLPRILAGWSLLIESVIVASLFNGMIFYIDDSNYYHYGSQWWLFYFSINTMIFVGFVAIVKHREALETKDKVLLLIYVLLPFIGFILQTLFVNLLLGHAFFMLATLIVYLNMQSQQGKLRKEQELMVMKSKVAIMISQIQPHFLYNSLSAIEKLCDEDVEKAKTAINDFGHYLRGNLDSLEQQKMIPFEDELEHVDTYIGLEKLRFGERLQVEYNIETEDFILPPLTVQPIVENAIRYGITKKREGGTIIISVKALEHTFRISVIDDGLGFDPEFATRKLKSDSRSHIGIENVRARLEALCGGSLEISSVLGEGTTAIITIPKFLRKED